MIFTMSTNFRESLKVVLTPEEEKRKREIEAYKDFINEALPGYVRFMEVLNSVIAQLEAKGIIGKTKIRARLKAINSAINNTDEKILDDIFGFELIAQNERDKEILMVIIHNLFMKEYIRQKNHNKSNGYFAHHCVGSVKRDLDGREALNLQEHILEAQTNELKEEYRDMPIKEQRKFKRSDIFTKKVRYPTLRNEILQQGKIDEKVHEGIKRALDFANQYLNREPELRKRIPVLEAQFKTVAVEEEAKRGTAQHVKYKSVNEDDVKTKYIQRKLVRGVDFPFVFVRNGEGKLEIEQTDKTLIDMWPFLEDVIQRSSEIHKYPIMNYDMYFAKVFPSLEPFVRGNLKNEPSLLVDNFSQENIWDIIKSKILRNDFVLPYGRQIEQLVVENE